MPQEKYVRARQLSTLATPFQVKFSSGWKEIARVEIKPTSKSRPDLTIVGLYNAENTLIAWFCLTTEVLIKEKENV